MRSPFFMYFSARSASWAPLLFQQMTRCHSVFSCFPPPCPVHCRLVASDSVATREPLFVLRTSGSAPKLPISMTLFRLRLTTTSQRNAGGAPRCLTVYDSQVILSIKDTPLGPNPRAPPPRRSHSGPEDHRIFDRQSIVAAAAADWDEAQHRVEVQCHRVRFADLEKHRANPPLAQRREHRLDERPAGAAPAPRRADAQVEDLRFVDGVAGDDVPRNDAVRFRHEERPFGGDALAEVARRPGIREARALDRGDRGDVSELGRTDPEAGVRGAPPSVLAPPPAARRPVRPSSGRGSGAPRR